MFKLQRSFSILDEPSEKLQYCLRQKKRTSRYAVSISGAIALGPVSVYLFQLTYIVFNLGSSVISTPPKQLSFWGTPIVLTECMLPISWYGSGRIEITCGLLWTNINLRDLFSVVRRATTADTASNVHVLLCRSQYLLLPQARVADRAMRGKKTKKKNTACHEQNKRKHTSSEFQYCRTAHASTRVDWASQ